MTGLDDDVARYLELEERRHELEAEQSAIKARLRDLGPGRHRTTAGVTVTVSVNRRFDPALAETVLGAIDPALVTACSVTKVDSAATKRKVGGDIYAACMKEIGEPRVIIT